MIHLAQCTPYSVQCTLYLHYYDLSLLIAHDTTIYIIHYTICK